MGDKQYKTEWSFSFDKIGERINDMVGSLSNDTEAKTETFAAEVDGASQATLNLHFSIGSMTMAAGTDKLMEADVTYVGDMEFVVEGDSHKTVTLKQKKLVMGGVVDNVRQAFGSINKRQDLKWDVRLTPDIPLDLNIQSGVGKLDCDLSNVKLTNFMFNGGTGETKLTLPQSDAGYNAKFSEGVGSTDIYLPENTDINMKISAGVGNVRLHVPGSVAIRVKVNGGLGNANIPKHFVEVERKNDFISKNGIWQTQGFSEANSQVEVDYSGGVGNFTIVTDVTVV